MCRVLWLIYADCLDLIATMVRICFGHLQECVCIDFCAEQKCAEKISYENGYDKTQQFLLSVRTNEITDLTTEAQRQLLVGP